MARRVNCAVCKRSVDRNNKGGRAGAPSVWEKAVAYCQTRGTKIQEDDILCQKCTSRIAYGRTHLITMVGEKPKTIKRRASKAKAKASKAKKPKAAKKEEEQPVVAA